MTTLPRGRVAPARLRVSVARFTLRHPEWWLVCASAAAWVLAWWLTAGPTSESLHSRHDVGNLVEGWSPGPFLVDIGMWSIMVVAMMGPVMVPRVRHVAECCVGRVRIRAILETLVGALLVWIIAGVLAIGLTSVAPGLDARESPISFLVVWLLVAGWQLMPSKTAAIGRCHAVRVPRGVAVGSRRLTAGIAYTSWCVVSCGPAMAAMAITGHPPLLMAALTFGFTAERVVHRPAHATRVLAVGVAATALATWLLASLGS